MIFVNVTVIYGTMKRANTYNCVQLLLNNLSITMSIKVTEFFLPKDLPLLYDNFKSNTTNSENLLRHLNSIAYITDSLDKSDLIILACPTLNCDITANMKLFFKNLHNKSIKNKSSSFMKNKIGLVISTSAGAGLSHSTEIMKKNLNYWGINNICKFSETFYETNWDYVTSKTKLKINKKIFKLSSKIIVLYLRTYTPKTSISNRILSSKIISIVKTSHSNVLNLSYDRNHSFHR